MGHLTYTAMYLTIEDNELELQRLHNSTVIAIGLDEVRPIVDKVRDNALGEMGVIVCSSAIDYPDDATTDAAIIAYCKEIRNQGGHR